MSRIVYVNGDYVPEQEAKVSVFDRAFLLADGIYEVTAVLDGRLVDFAPHVARLQRSLGEIGMECPLSPDELQAMHEELVARNDLSEGVVYLQVTRGVADRDFAHDGGLTPTVVAFTQIKALRDPPQAKTGVSVVTVPDIRWKRRDIKSTALLAQVMAKQAARDRGAYEAVMVEDGEVTEGASSSIFIVAADGTVVTRPLGPDILPGVTRRAILQLAETAQIRIEERRFTVEEAKRSREMFLTSASSFVLPIVTIDGVTVGDGRPGPVAGRLRDIYLAEARKGPSSDGAGDACR